MEYKVLSTDVIESNSTGLIVPGNKHFIEHYLQNKRRKSEYTYKSYKLAIKDFFKVKDITEIDIDNVIDVTIFDAENYLNELTNRGYAPATVNQKIYALSSFYKWLLAYADNRSGKTIIHYNPFTYLASIKPEVINKKPTPYLTPEEMSRFLNCINIDTVIGLRNRAIFALAFTTSLRKSNIINIKIGDLLNIQGYTALRVIQKRKKEHHSKIVPEVKLLIDMYLKKTNRDYDNNADDYLFLGHSNNTKEDKLSPSALNKIIKVLAERANIKKWKDLRVHSTRHSAITAAILAGVPIQEVQQNLSGHSDIRMVMKYTHIQNSMKNNPSDAINIF